MTGLGLGLGLGFPNGRPRGDSGGPVTRLLAGTVDADPNFSANLSAGVELQGTIQVNPSLWGGLDPLRILTGTVQVDPGFTADLEVILALAGAVDTDPTFEADLGVVVALAGAVDVDPIFEADLEDPPDPVYEGPTYVGEGSWSVAAGSTANLSGIQGVDGDLIVLLCESARQTPITTPSGFTFIGAVQLGTAGNVNATQLTVYAGYRSGSTMSITSASGIDHMVGIYLVFSGALTGSAANACEILGTAAVTAVTAQPAGPITPDGANTMFLVASSHGKDNSADEGTFGNVSGLVNATQRAFRGTLTGNGGGVQALTGEKMASGNLTPVPSITYLDSRPVAMAVIAINPAP